MRHLNESDGWSNVGCDESGRTVTQRGLRKEGEGETEGWKAELSSATELVVVEDGDGDGDGDSEVDGGGVGWRYGGLAGRRSGGAPRAATISCQLRVGSQRTLATKEGHTSFSYQS